uniref:Protein kinase domain-containing protein n=1 Tax=Alexandrium catenella TaxID=2925 RepID=A0A7S1Q5U9_ALECA|mmetsp:Transcript_17622/g.47882  ORF Transcript_17622/g.47882 Transcript_17622/m.47882 type:complete len:335 (+) Transcript_17622:63-1067(+)
MVYPCSFVSIAKKRLEELPWLERDKWHKVRTLAEANYGKVYLAEASLPGLPRVFALKQMRRAAVLANGRRLESAANEIHAALAVARLRLPYVAKVLFAAQDQDHFYLATEYCEHGELFSVLQSKGRFKSEQVLREVSWQVLQTLQALHNTGVAHRDVSLENLLVAADGSLRLIDFGQALLIHSPGRMDGEAPVSPLAEGLPGKDAYRAPETIALQPYLASKLDVFACGILMYTLAVGSYPYSNGNSGYLFPSEELRAERCVRLAPQLRELGFEDCVSPGLLDLLEQMLAPDPEKRITAEEALHHPWLAGTLDGLDALLSEGLDLEGVCVSEDLN